MIIWKEWFSRNGLKGDLAGGLTTAIVSLPMALAFGVASGAGAQAGLYGAVMVGFWAALFGGTRTLISEPTGPMTLMVATLMTNLAVRYPENPVAAGFAVIVLAGMFQALFGVLKLGRYITLMPYSVISGFMSGIGVLLMILQLAPLLGYPVPPGGAPGVLAQLPGLIADARPAELLLGSLALITLFAFPASWRRRVPPQLAVLILGTLYASLFFHAAGLRVIGEIPMGLPRFQWPVFAPELAGTLLVDALLLAMLGCIDTVLTAMISDSLTRSRHDTNRELIGQGIANTLSGLFGGLPGAGATMGTVVNIQAGATSPRAGMIRALILLAVMLAAAPLLSGVPMVILAAITFKVGLDILDWSFLRRAHRVSMTSAVMMYGVMAITVLVDIMVAVGIGVFIANLITIDRLSRLQAGQVKTLLSVGDEPVRWRPEEKQLLDQAGRNIVVLHLSGPMIFGVARSIAIEQQAMQEARALIVDLCDVPMLSITVAMSIENVVRDAQSHDCVVVVAGASPPIRERLAGLGIVGPDSRTLEAPDRLSALRQSHALILRPVEETYAEEDDVNRAG